MVRIEEILERVVRKFPTRPAISCGSEEVTYLAFRQRALGLAKRIGQIVRDTGCPIGILLPNAISFAEAVFAIWYSRNIVFPLKPSASRQSLQRIIDRFGIRLVLVDQCGQQKVGDLVGACIDVAGELRSDGMGTIEQNKPNRLNLTESQAVMFLTSGTTGMSKTVGLTHENILQNLTSARSSIPQQAYIKTYVGVPMYHSYGFSLQFLATLCSGGHIYIGQRSKIFTDLAREFLNSGCVSIFGVPAFFRVLIDGIDRCQLRSQAERIKCLVSGASAMTKDLLSELQNTFRQAEICLTYGLSEASPLVTVLPPSWLGRKGCSIGLPVEGVELKLLTADGRLTREADSVGEILIRGKSVIDHYVDNPEANAACLHDGFLKTGDIAMVDSDGCLFFRGRAKDIINRGGENIYPCEVEEVLLRRDEIEQVAVVSCPHRILGEVPFAFVKPADGKSELNWPEIKQWCSTFLSAEEIPVGAQMVESFPTTATGKIRKDKLSATLVPFEGNNDE